MEKLFGGSETNQKTIIGHPVGLFVLFFTEMWEGFSYYGMRALLVLYLVSSIADGGLAWNRADALILYSWYTMLVYLTPILGGFIADEKLGFRKAIVLGAIIMTAGHAFMAFETTTTFYIGLFLIIIGNGLFKPNISSMVGQMYPDGSERKDSAYTIFYMGINSGAFLGILLCGYIGEKVGWSYGFGLAGIFMFFGMLQFWFGQKIFGDIGLAPKDQVKKIEVNKEKTVPFSKVDSLLFYLANIAAGIWIIGGVFETVAKKTLFANDNVSVICVSVALGGYLLLTIVRLVRYQKVERDRLIVIALLSFFTVFFWMAFEQAGGSMTLFAKDYTNRVLEPGASAITFKLVNAALTFIPLGILTYILIKLAQNIKDKFPLTILFTGLSFGIIWLVAIFMVRREFYIESSEIPASWFQVLNSFFIITFAPVFSKIWTGLTGTKFNPSAAVKFAIGLVLVGVGFGALSWGGLAIPQGASTAQVNMIWLILAFLFHTLGELCVSPVGLSYVNKLSPKRLVGLMFGIWFIANAVANKLAGVTGSLMDKISSESSMSGFFLIFVIISFIIAIIAVLLSKTMKRMMHGVE